MPRVPRRIVIAVLALALFAPPAAAAAPVGMIEELPMHANVGGIAPGPEGNLWFTLNTPFGKEGRNAIGRISPSGEIAAFPLPPRAYPILEGPAPGPDSNESPPRERSNASPRGSAGGSKTSARSPLEPTAGSGSGSKNARRAASAKPNAA